MLPGKTWRNFQNGNYADFRKLVLRRESENGNSKELVLRRDSETREKSTTRVLSFYTSLQGTPSSYHIRPSSKHNRPPTTSVLLPHQSEKTESRHHTDNTSDQNDVPRAPFGDGRDDAHAHGEAHGAAEE